MVANLRRRGEPQYIEEILSGGSEDSGGADMSNLFSATDTEADPLYDQAVFIVTESRRASISGVQRRLKVGYNRAARMIEQMEESRYCRAVTVERQSRRDCATATASSLGPQTDCLARKRHGAAKCTSAALSTDAPDGCHIPAPDFRVRSVHRSSLPFCLPKSNHVV